MIEENHYSEAIQKLEHDILEKLNADGRVDWVSEPTLIDELAAFNALLKYKNE